MRRRRRTRIFRWSRAAVSRNGAPRTRRGAARGSRAHTDVLIRLTVAFITPVPLGAHPIEQERDAIVVRPRPPDAWTILRPLMYFEW